MTILRFSLYRMLFVISFNLRWLLSLIHTTNFVFMRKTFYHKYLINKTKKNDNTIIFPIHIYDSDNESFNEFDDCQSDTEYTVGLSID